MGENSEIHCPHFDSGLCRSCVLLADQPTSVEKIRRHKVDRLQTVFHDVLGPEAAALVRGYLFSPDQVFGSRMKAKFSVSGTVAEPVIGFVDEQRQVRPLLDCPLHHPVLNQIAEALRLFITQAQLTPYDIELRQGELKGLMLKTSLESSGAPTETIVRFVLRSQEGVFRIRKHLAALLAIHPSIRVVSANIQPLPAALLEGPDEIFLTSTTYIREQFSEKVTLAFGPQSFSQVTSQVAQGLYRYVASKIEQLGIRRLLDLYCGVGGFSFFAAPLLEWGHGVEYSSQAIELAQLAQVWNQAPHLQFTQGDVEVFLQKDPKLEVDAVLLNPPRRGLTQNVIASLLELRPSYLIYSSCNPQTLVRDLDAVRSKYLITEIEPFDMFPLTDHLEVVVFLKRR